MRPQLSSLLLALFALGLSAGCSTQTTIDPEGRPIRDPGSTSFVGAIETAEEFGTRIYAEAIRRGLNRARRVVVLGAPRVHARDRVDLLGGVQPLLVGGRGILGLSEVGFEHVPLRGEQRSAMSGVCG